MSLVRKQCNKPLSVLCLINYICRLQCEAKKATTKKPCYARTTIAVGIIMIFSKTNSDSAPRKVCSTCNTY